ncbi:MAG: hypothetical protein Q9160_004706 [Pyrenula sp. 1 TL-2023]
MPDIPQIPSNQRPGNVRSGDTQSNIGEVSQSMEAYHSLAPDMGRLSIEASPYGMGGLAQVSPQYQSPLYSYGPQSFSHQFTTPGRADQSMPYQSLQSSHFAGQGAIGNPSFNAPYVHQYPNQIQNATAYRHSNQHFMTTASGRPQPAMQQPYMEHPMISHNQSPSHYQPSYHPNYGSQYHQSSAGLHATTNRGHPLVLTPVQNVQYGSVPQPLPMTANEGFPGSPSMRTPSGYMGHPQSVSRKSSDSNMTSSIPRGPPRKPKQSGHALWVGNLPPGATVFDLKDHFSRDATSDIESVFLISKSNCAFVNYKSEGTCAAAMTRFHDSRFQGVRLVCRLRRGTGATPAGTPIGPSATQSPLPREEFNKTIPKTQSPKPTEASGSQSPQEGNVEIHERILEKYFVVKSLTIEDLELSVRNGIWATQAHNEASLNQAYESAENVYLIFSANKSGEYFGYARMVSAIDEEAAVSIALPARAGPETLTEHDVPTTIPTPATEFAPKGRIIDDSARGTIFWEAADSAESPSTEEPDALSFAESASPIKEVSEQESFGKPFKIKWLSTERLPFYRTRGLRNPWNANREVKIARDGTELEPGVGRRLVGMFHRPQASGPSPTGRGVGMGYPTPGYS